jgi:hypothetical protein
MVGGVLKSVSRRSLLTLEVVVFAMTGSVTGVGEANIEIRLGIWAYECFFEEYSMSLLKVVRSMELGGQTGNPRFGISQSARSML